MPIPWNPFHPAVFVAPDPHAARISLVRHDGYPYEEDWNEGATGWSGLFDIANRYVALVNSSLKLPSQWLDTLQEQPPTGPPLTVWLHWLRDPDPRHSYWVKRQGGLDAPSRPSNGPVRDRTAVLLAGLYQELKKRPLYGGQGLRIVVQTGPEQSQPRRVRITGVASTLPSAQAAGEARVTDAMFEDLPRRIRQTFGLPLGVGLVDVGLRVPDVLGASPIIVAKTTPGGDHYADEPASSLLVMRHNEDREHRLEPLSRRLLIAAANGTNADVLVQDPVSRNGAADFTKLRPNRSWTVLDPEKVNVPLGNLPPGGAPGSVQLVDPDPNNDPDFRVVNSRLVDPPALDAAAREVQPPLTPHVRTNVFAAVNAFFHTRQLFDRLRHYGLAPAEYFRFVARPIDVRYRSGIRPGFGDGRTVNAQVRWTLRPDKAVPTPGLIELCFALGDLDSAVGRLPANLPPASAPERSPLGVATDPRWCWHEYSHVLITAAVGDLELHFAHSAGDAIAAILSDPDSQLATSNGPWRGVTFPWVLIPRRHDRRVEDGWSWTGPLNQREVYFAVPGQSDKRGYWAEQILSSSLFRLYRAIGGDSALPPALARQNAADYVVYLIMRAIESLGWAWVVPSTEPDQFVDALRKVDTATATAPGPGGYVGGTVHKAVQWAFERQGLYAAPVPNSAVSGPWEAASVDLHIKDQRPTPEGPYSPVDLRGNLWQADPNVFWVTTSFFGGRKKIRVMVQNRGIVRADNTRVDIWVARVDEAAVPPAPKIPDFPDPPGSPNPKWQHVGNATRSVPGRSGQTPGARTFGPFNWTPPEGPQRYAILAAASCDGDLSNIDPTTGHPCVTVPGPIELLVACDNNLGLITVMVD